MPKKWRSYSTNGTYFKINLGLLNSTADLESSNNENIRDELYNFWHVDLEKDSKCSNQDYESNNHTSGLQPELDKCLEYLDTSSEYVNLRENFLIEYETCMNTLEASSKFKNSSLRNLFNTHCLDAIAVRRLLIEQELCCNNNSKNSNTSQTYSTVCDFNLNKDYLNKKVICIAENVLLSSSSSYSPPVCTSSRIFDKEFFLYKIFLFNFFILKVVHLFFV